MDDRFRELLHDLDSGIEDVRRCSVVWLTQLGGDDVIPHLERMTADSSPSVRYFARVGLAELSARSSPGGPSQSTTQAAAKLRVEELPAALRHTDPRVRLLAAMRCYRKVPAELGPLLVARLREDPHNHVRASLVKAVAAQGNPANRDLLLGYLMDDDPRVRANTIEALAAFTHDAEVLSRVSVLVEDHDNRVRANALLFLKKADVATVREAVRRMLASGLVWMVNSAVYVLSNVDQPWGVEMLRELAANSGAPPQARDKAMLALRGLGQASQLPGPGATPAGRSAPVAPPVPPAVVAPVPAAAASPPGPHTTGLTEDLPPIVEFSDFLRCLADADYRLRVHAVQNADRFESGAVLARLRESLAREQHGHVLATLVKWLGKLGGAPEVAVLVPYLKHEDPRIRANALEGLEAIGNLEASEAARPMLEDPHPRVKAAAARFLHAHDRGRALETLKAMLLSEDEAPRDAAIFALGGLDSGEAAELLETALESRDEALQVRSLKVLARLGSQASQATRLLAAYLKEAADGRGREAAVERLLARMNDRSPGVRLRTLERLAEIHDERAQQRIELAVNDVDASVQSLARELMLRISAEADEQMRLSSLGIVVFRQCREGLKLEPLQSRIDELATLGQLLDRGVDVTATMAVRFQRLVELGRMVLSEQESLGLQDAKILDACRRARERSPSDPPPTEQRRSGNRLVTTAVMSAAETERLLAGSREATAGEVAVRREWRGVVRQYGWLMLSAGVALAICGLIVLRLFAELDRPAQQAVRQARPSAITLVDVMKVRDPRQFVGRLVVWRGVVGSIAENRREASLACDEGVITVRFLRPFGPGPLVGAPAEVEGILLERSGAGVVLSGRRLTAVAAGP